MLSPPLFSLPGKYGSIAEEGFVLEVAANGLFSLLLLPFLLLCTHGFVGTRQTVKKQKGQAAQAEMIHCETCSGEEEEHIVPEGRKHCLGKGFFQCFRISGTRRHETTGRQAIIFPRRAK